MVENTVRDVLAYNRQQKRPGALIKDRNLPPAASPDMARSMPCASALSTVMRVGACPIGLNGSDIANIHVQKNTVAWV